jgi:hypothetical protein
MFKLQTQQKLRLVVYVPEAYTGYVNHHSEINFTVAIHYPVKHLLPK